MPQYATPTSALTVGTRRAADRYAADREIRYVGVLRHGRAIVAECGHDHINRDASSRSGGTSAADCIRYTVRAATLNTSRPAVRQHLVQSQRDAWQNLRRGHHTPADVIDRARVEAAARAEAADQLVGLVIELLADSRYQRADR